MENFEVKKDLVEIQEKLNRVLDILERLDSKKKVFKDKVIKPKSLPITQEEIDSHKHHFENLFEKWVSGDITEVEESLEKFDAEEIRRFADANNLNVTSKMPKQKVLSLIASRFREKKQLFRTTSLKQDHTESPFVGDSKLNNEE